MINSSTISVHLWFRHLAFFCQHPQVLLCVPQSDSLAALCLCQLPLSLRSAFTYMQLRGKCLEVLVQLLQKFEGDAEASRAFLSADADSSNISGVGGGSAATSAGAGSSSLSSTVARCMATVTSQDPSAAHTALAGQATAVLQRLNST